MVDENKNGEVFEETLSVLVIALTRKLGGEATVTDEELNEIYENNYVVDTSGGNGEVKLVAREG